MSLHFFALIQISIITLIEAESCPSVCTCKTATLSDLPINSVLVKSQHVKPSDQKLPSYQNQNEVLDETDEHEAEHQLGGGKLRAATCILQPTNNLPLFLSLPIALEVLTILQGPGTGNLTLDESYFQHLQKLVVLEIHGFEHSTGVLRLRNNALNNLQLLRYLNLQHLHLLGDRTLGNRPVPLSGSQFTESNMIPGAVRFTAHKDEEETNSITEALQFIPDQGKADIVPYSVYRDQQERAGLSSFAGLRHLLFLRAFHCNIKEINWEMFIGLQKLEYLSLEGNRIPFLHEFSFYGTPNLKHLTISHNKLLDVQSIGLAGLLKLEILDLSFNNISHLSELSLPPLPQLITADFHHNPLEKILPFTFQVMNNTEKLFLGEKQGKLEIYHNSFLGLSKLNKLSLNGLNLEVLEREYLKGMPLLRELRMEGTVHELAFDAFAEVPKLEELILKHCSIRKISMDAFFGLYGLIYLDLSHNKLETLPPLLFDQQTSLKEIYLCNNKLTTLPENLFLNVPAKLIRLDKNPWHCSCSMNEWQPSQINKVKVKITDNSLCQSRYDKSSMCKIHYIYQYTYEQSVSPRCATPARFSGWSVFHLLRKHLRCYKKFYKQKMHLHKHKPKKTTVHTSEEIHKTAHPNNQNHSNIVITVLPKSETTLQNQHTNKPEKLTAGLSISESDSRMSTTLKTSTGDNTKDQEEQTTESTENSTDEATVSLTVNKTIEHQNNDSTTDTNQNMWTKKDKAKYKLLQEKLLNKSTSTKVVKQDKPVPANVKINDDLPTKSKKKSDILKKWETKMENTIRRLNKLP